MQLQFLGLDAEEALFGGAAGGGKSDAMLMAALQYVDVPGYAAGIFRLTKADMLKPDAILARANTWLQGTRAWWDEDAFAWMFPTGGAPATLHFGYADSLASVSTRYQGPAFQFIGIDELGQWGESTYRYLFSRLRRRLNVQVPLRMRATANPGGKGHDWVKRRFIEYARHTLVGSSAREDLKRLRNDKVQLPEPRVYASPPSTDAQEAAASLGLQAQPVYFVPSFTGDNPGLDQQGYAMQLSKLDPVTRRQLKEGDWDASFGGNLFKPEWFKIVGPEEVPQELRWVRSWDFAATEQEAGKDPDWTANGKLALERLYVDPKAKHTDDNLERRLWVDDVDRFRLGPGPTEAKVRLVAKKDGRRVPVVVEQEPGSAGKTVIHGLKTRILVGHAVIGMRKTGPKQEYWAPVSSLAEAGNVYLVRGPWNEDFLKELRDLPGEHDDQADMLGQGFAHLVDETAWQREKTRAAAAL